VHLYTYGGLGLGLGLAFLVEFGLVYITGHYIVLYIYTLSTAAYTKIIFGL